MLNKKMLFEIAKAVEEYNEMLAHLSANADQIREILGRSIEMANQQVEVVKDLEGTHAMLAEIKTKQQTVVTRQRELAGLVTSNMDRLRAISDDNQALLGKLAESIKDL